MPARLAETGMDAWPLRTAAALERQIEGVNPGMGVPAAPRDILSEQSRVSDPTGCPCEDNFRSPGPYEATLWESRPCICYVR
jgi:hypothetical protein